MREAIGWIALLWVALLIGGYGWERCGPYTDEAREKARAKCSLDVTYGGTYGGIVSFARDHDVFVNREWWSEHILPQREEFAAAVSKCDFDGAGFKIRDEKTGAVLAGYGRFRGYVSYE